MTEVKTCSHTKDDGSPCGAAAVRNTPYCYFHRKYYQPPALPGERNYQAPLLESNEAIELAATQLFQSLVTGTMEQKQVALALNILRLAEKAISNIERSRKEEAKAAGREEKAAKAATTAEKPASRGLTQDLIDMLESMRVKDEPPTAEAQSSETAERKPPQPAPAPAPAYKGDRIVDPYGCLAHLKT